MKNLISGLLVAGALTFSANALAQPHDFGDKMPEIKGVWLESGICRENQEGSRPSYYLYGVNGFKRKITEVKIELEGKGVLIVKYGGNSRVYSDLNGNGIIDGIQGYSEIWFRRICPKLELD